MRVGPSYNMEPETGKTPRKPGIIAWVVTAPVAVEITTSERGCRTTKLDVELGMGGVGVYSLGLVYPTPLFLHHGSLSCSSFVALDGVQCTRGAIAILKIIRVQYA